MSDYKTKIIKGVDYLYIAVLLFIFSSTIILGAFVAPVVFKSYLYIDVVLNRFDNGLIMSEIFRRFGNLLSFLLLLITLYHAYYYKKFLSSYLTIIAFCLFAVSSLLFNFYFTEGVFAFIAQGEEWINNNIELFEAFHKASEIDFSIIMFSALALVILKIRQ
ncbi:MAG: DUF4149 domain-containing protein [Arcobacter butzleri]|nr:DUF4149 domain-containing protein [Aliarcobacter butzleri]